MFPVSSSNAYAHLSVEDFSDVVKRMMPEGDENPFLQPQGGGGGAGGGAGAGGFDPAELAEMLEDVGAEMGHLPGFENAAARWGCTTS
jgi:hypothetical protein